MIVKPLPKKLFAQLEQGERVTTSGIVILDDNGKEHGIRARWGRVTHVGADIADVAVGQWILVEHGRWTMTIELKQDDGSMFKFQMIDYNGIIGVQDEAPTDQYIGRSYDYGSQIRAEDFGAR
jgi:co-chaperonin GroES (HSP10)